MPHRKKQHILTTGDVVAFAFPYVDGRLKNRTCVIVDHDPVEREVVVAYGTTNLCLKANPDYALALVARSEWQPIGLHKPTRFQIDRRIRVSLSDHRFRCHSTLGTPRIGQLAPRQVALVTTLYQCLPMASHRDEWHGIHPKKRPGRITNGAHRRPMNSMTAQIAAK